MNNKPKWENQNNVLRAIIQSKRAEKNVDKKKDIKIEIEEPKKIYMDNKFGSLIYNSNRLLYSKIVKDFYDVNYAIKNLLKLILKVI